VNVAAVDQRLSVVRRNRTVDYIQRKVDGADSEAMEKILKTWLEGKGWSQGLWDEFRLVSYEPRRREVMVTP
jgi:hypothetical protein